MVDVPHSIISLDQPLSPEDGALADVRSVETHLLETAQQLDNVVSPLRTLLAGRITPAHAARLPQTLPSLLQAIDGYVAYQRHFLDDQDGDVPPAFLAYEQIRLATVDAAFRPSASRSPLQTLTHELDRVDGKLGVVEELAKYEIFRKLLAAEHKALSERLERLEGETHFLVARRLKRTEQLLQTHEEFQRDRIHGEIVFMDNVQAREHEDRAYEIANEHAEVFRQLLQELDSPTRTADVATPVDTTTTPADEPNAAELDEIRAQLQSRVDALVGLQGEFDNAILETTTEREHQNDLADQRPSPELPTHDNSGLTAMVWSPHPDDNANSVGAQAALADLGFEITEVVVTGGEAGRILVPQADTPRTARRHGSHRLQHVSDSVHVAAGEKAHSYWLNRMADSGMPGKNGQYRRGTFAWHMENNEEQTIDAAVRLIRHARPDILFNWPPAEEQGDYPHIDHINTHVLVHKAQELARNPEYRPELGKAHTPLVYAYVVWSPEQLVAIDRAGRSIDQVGGTKHDLVVPFSHDAHVRAAKAMQAHPTQIGETLRIFDHSGPEVITHLPAKNYLKVVDSVVPLRLGPETTLQSLIPGLTALKSQGRTSPVTASPIAEASNSTLVPAGMTLT